MPNTGVASNTNTLNLSSLPSGGPVFFIYLSYASFFFFFLARISHFNGFKELQA